MPGNAIADAIGDNDCAQVLLHPVEAMDSIGLRHQYRVTAHVIANDGGRNAVRLGNGTISPILGQSHTGLRLPNQLVAQVNEPAAEKRYRWRRLNRPLGVRHPSVQVREEIAAGQIDAVG